jgi:heptosyltransferase-2
MSLSAFELLKMEYPDAKFTILCKAYCRDIFRGKGVESFIIDSGKKFELIKKLKKNHYDLGVLFHNTLKDALIFKLSSIDKIIGYDKESRRVFLDFYLKIDRSRHYINHYANLVNSYLDDKYKILPDIKLTTKPSTLLKKEDSSLVGFTLGGGKDSRSYPTKLSLELFELLKKSNIHVVLLGDKKESIVYKEYEKKLKELDIKHTNLAGKTTISELIDAIATLDLLVTIDSSPMHIAAATNTKFITLLGKGTSAFDTVKPKVSFGSYIFEGEKFIKDEDLIASIEPQTIKEEIQKRLHES